MHRRRLLRSTAVAATAATAGCLGGLFGSSDIRVTDVSSDGSAGIVSIDVTVENTADGRRRGTVVAELDVSGRSGSVSKRTGVGLDPGETTTAEFLFTDVVPAGSDTATYTTDARVTDVYDPSNTADVTRRTAESDALGVTVTVTYPGDDDGRRPTLSRTEYQNVYCPVTERSAVTPFVNFSLSGRARAAEVTFSYEPSAVPDGDEDGLVLMRFSRQKQQFLEASSSSVDPAADTVTGTVRHDGIVDVVVFHRPTWERAAGDTDESIVTICRS